MIGVGLVLIGGWLGTNKFGQYCILGILLNLIVQLVETQSQQDRSKYIYQYQYQKTAPLQMPYLPEVELIQADPDIQSFRYTHSLGIDIKGALFEYTN